LKKNERKLISGLSVLFVAVLGVVMQLLLSRRPSEAFAQFNYYTLQTNLIVSIVAFLNIVSDWKGWKSHKVGEVLRILNGGSVLWITVTMTIYHLFLSGYYRPEGIALIANTLLHYVTPVAAIIHWAIFEERSSYRSFYPLLWVLYPFGYAAVSVVRGELNGFYPYWFLNPSSEYPAGIGSYTNLFVFILSVGAIFVVIGYLMVLLNHLSPRHKLM